MSFFVARGRGPSGEERDIAVDASGSLSLSHLAGERHADSIVGRDHLATAEEWEATTVDLSANSTTIYDGPAICGGIYVNMTISAHATILKDDSTSKLTIPASSAAGFCPAIRPFCCYTSLIIDPDDSATGNVTVFWRVLDSSVESPA